MHFVSGSWCKEKDSSHLYLESGTCVWLHVAQKTIYIFWIYAQETRMVSSHVTDVMSVLVIWSAPETPKKFKASKYLYASSTLTVY